MYFGDKKRCKRLGAIEHAITTGAGYRQVISEELGSDAFKMTMHKAQYDFYQNTHAKEYETQANWRKNVAMRFDRMDSNLQTMAAMMGKAERIITEADSNRRTKQLQSLTGQPGPFSQQDMTRVGGLSQNERVAKKSHHNLHETA